MIIARTRLQRVVVALTLLMIGCLLGGALLSKGDRRIGAALELIAIAIGVGGQLIRQPWTSRVNFGVIALGAAFYAWWYLTSLTA